MKYWIFQNNQVLGPYEPDEMGKISVFSPESLVCPEGRRGTSMGDWQRAGMVPDLSVALVRASSSGEGRTSVLSIAGLPPEPTLKDLAQLGSIQEKVAMLEEVVLQLQEGLRAKDAELSSVHQALAGKSLEASEIKNEAVSRQREADELKRQISGLEDRLSSVRLLSETLDKAVEEEKKVEQDVEKQGQTITDLARDVEELRRQLEESKTRQAEIAAAPRTSPVDSPKPSQPIPLPAPVSFDLPSESEIFPPPPPPPPAAAAMPVPIPVTATVPAPVPSPAAPMEFPTINAAPLPSFDASMPSMPADAAAGFTPPAFGDSVGGALAPSATPVPAPAAEAVGVVPQAPAPKGKTALLIGVVAGIAALGGLAVMGGFVPGLRKPQAPAAVLTPTPLPPPEPLPPPVVVPDSRQLAIEFAKAWPLPGDRTLERVLESLAPSAGNLSPWMAEPLAGGRVQLNYFARSTAPGAPTIAYEFEVDLEGKTLVGRNAAAKSVLTGKASAPPAPPKPKPVKVKPKAPVKKAPEEDTLDSMLGDTPAKGGGTTLTDTGDAPAKETDIAPSEETVGEPLNEPAGEPPVEAKPRAARAKPASRAAKAKAGKTPAKDSPADESLLDDLLKE